MPLVTLDPPQKLLLRYSSVTPWTWVVWVDNRILDSEIVEYLVRLTLPVVWLFLMFLKDLRMVVSYWRAFVKLRGSVMGRHHLHVHSAPSYCGYLTLRSMILMWCTILDQWLISRFRGSYNTSQDVCQLTKQYRLIHFLYYTDYVGPRLNHYDCHRAHRTRKDLPLSPKTSASLFATYSFCLATGR